MTVERPRSPGISPPGLGDPGTVDPAHDVDLAEDDAWYAPSVADAIALSPDAARRLAEPARTRAFVMDGPERSHAVADAGGGRSIALDDGLYRLERRR